MHREGNLNIKIPQTSHEKIKLKENKIA